MSQKFTVLFDLDGTLVDTAPDLMVAHNHVMKKFGYEERGFSDIKKLAGAGSRAMLKKSIHAIAELSGKIKKTDEKIEEEMTKEFINFYSKNINNKSKLITGAFEFLNWCKNNSISMAVCTNKQEHLAVDLLKKIKIYDFFEFVAGGNTFEYCKPDPRHLTNIIEILGGDIKKSIMIGDSENDADAAKLASIPMILLKDGYTEKKVEQIYHNHLIENFVGIEKIISSYLNG